MYYYFKKKQQELKILFDLYLASSETLPVQLNEQTKTIRTWAKAKALFLCNVVPIYDEQVIILSSLAA